MKRSHFIGLTGGALAVAAGAVYLPSDKRNLLREDLAGEDDAPASTAVAVPLPEDEREILALASLAPSGHNTQPWFVQALAPGRWIIGQDRRRWLPAVDPDQRETMLSVGAFLQNLEYAAAAYGYSCRWTLLAAANQDERVMEVALAKTPAPAPFDLAAIRDRRTVRAGFSRDPLRAPDVARLLGAEREFIHYLPTGGPESRWLDVRTIEANRLQSLRDPAQRELGRWIRFSSADVREYRDGLSTGGMEITGGAGWWVRNFYGVDDVMAPAFRARSVESVRGEVAASAGWILITSPDSTVGSLLDAGRRMERLFLQVRALGVALHPMTQILEEPVTRRELDAALGIGKHVQFILRVGYLADYPPPFSLRRPVEWFWRPPGPLATTPERRFRTADVA
jgi:nitroreductase